ncbi:MAG: DUF481 domain-containing protein [Gammaproteobacteria bacterium]|nr:DUF481 domain-containing protein [Gammaproteobacteria bacterium]
MLRITLVILFLTTSFIVYAQEQSVASESLIVENAENSAEPENTAPEQPPVKQFSGEGSLGWISSKGNTNNDSLNADLKAVLRSGRWLHSFAITAKKVKEEDVVTAERYLFTEKSDLAISEMTYAFESLRYDDDRFDGFEYQTSATIGIGWHLINVDTQHLNLELGAGYRRSELTATAEENSETISRLAQHYDVKLGDTTQLYQDLLIESGNLNTTSEFTAGLKLKINSKLALKLSYNVKHNSDPAPDNESTDRTTTINLVFGF